MGIEQIWSMILGWVGVGVTALGFFLARRGKKRDEQATEAQNSWQRILSEVEYWKKTANDERDAKSRLVAEWEGRWSRQMDRCKSTLDPAWNALTTLLRGNSLTDEQRQQAEREISAIQQHRDNDHPV